MYDSWGVCSEYVLSFSDDAYQSHFTRFEAEAAYAIFLEQRNKDHKSRACFKTVIFERFSDISSVYSYCCFIVLNHVTRMFKAVELCHVQSKWQSTIAK
jgi:hypothetical protein